MFLFGSNPVTDVDTFECAKDKFDVVIIRNSFGYEEFVKCVLRRRRVCGVVSPPVRMWQCSVIGCSTVASEGDIWVWIYVVFLWIYTYDSLESDVVIGSQDKGEDGGSSWGGSGTGGGRSVIRLVQPLFEWVTGATVISSLADKLCKGCLPLIWLKDR